jgi:FkbM family methyltransferase
MFHSEHKQDSWLYENVFKDKRNGVFVEFGAIDGIITSNSLFFEQEMGWTGLCIEAIPEMYEKLKQNRKCICENYAISDNDGIVKFMVYPEVIGWSGIKDTIEPQHQERINNRGGEVYYLDIKTCRLNYLLDKHNLTNIDYMSIDVEGNEEKIVKSIDFSKFYIHVLDIENNFNNYDVRFYLKGLGYDYLQRLGVNDIFIRSSK